MRIVQVVLHNVKSYAGPTTINLVPGINAVCGENGAGKSTILEAIGFALFGYRPYRLDAFLREGEKSGSITVTVEGDDSCSFHVVRKLGSGGGQAVYDELDRKVAEGEVEVRRWRLDFFGLEPGTDLEELFRDTIGPPQGTLTAIFMEAAGARKEKFDRLLGITEYREAAEGLREVRGCFEQQAVDAERRAASLEGDVRRLPEVEARQLELAHRKGELAERVAGQARLQTELAAEREGLEKAQLSVQRAQAELRLAESRDQEARRRHQEQAAELERAEKAARRVEESGPGSHAHQAAVALLRALEERRKERDRLRQRAEMAARNALHWEREVATVLDRLSALERDGALAAERESLVPEQESREAAVRRAEERVRAREEAAGQLPEVAKRLKSALDRLSEAAEQLSRVEAARPVAAGLEGLRQRERALREEMARLEKQGWELKQAGESLEAATGRLEQLVTELGGVRSELDALRPLEPLAALAASRQQARDAASSLVAGLQARQQEARRSRKQVEGGLCPFLHEPCRNLRPGVSLDAHFDELIANTAAGLEGSRAALAAAESSLEQARSAEKAISRLQDLQRRTDQLSQEQARLEGEIARLQGEHSRLASTSPAREQTRRALQALEEELAGAEEASRIVDGEALWRRQSEESLQSKEREERLLVELRARAERESTAADDLEAARRALREMADPRSEAAALRQRVARERPVAERALERAQRDSASARAVEEEASRALEPFASLEEEMGAAAAGRDRNEQAHRAFLANQAEAERLPHRWEAHRRAVLEASRTTEALVEARHTLEATLASYDETEHLRLRGKLEEVAAALSRDQKELELCGQEEQRLLLELAELLRSRARREVAQQEAAESRRLKDSVEAIRDALKRAGPEIARELLRRVSARATGIHRELMGQPAVSLEWGSDYDIGCRIRAEEREFKQLSGGEQMAAALAVRLALLQTISNIKMAFLDEPTAHMDAARRVNLAGQLQKLHSFDQLVVISHDDSFDTLFGHVVHLAKRDGATVVDM